MTAHEKWKTLFRSFVAASCLSLVVTYLLYFASPGLAVMEVCEILAIPSSATVQYFGVKSQLAFFETAVNSAFYTVLVFSIALLYRKIRRKSGTENQSAR
jgi:hypothetical protein